MTQSLASKWLHYFYSFILVRMYEIKPKWHYRANCLHQTEKNMLTDKIPEMVEQLFPRCVVYLRLSGSSWALFKKKITQNKELSLFGRMQIHLWAPEDAFSTYTDKSRSCHSADIYISTPPVLQFFSSKFHLMWSPHLIFPATHPLVSIYICQSVFISACLSNQRETRIRSGPNWWENWKHTQPWN